MLFEASVHVASSAPYLVSRAKAGEAAVRAEVATNPAAKRAAVLPFAVFLLPVEPEGVVWDQPFGSMNAGYMHLAIYPSR